MIQYHTVGLLIPVRDGESDPAQWDWQTLVDTADPVIVEHAHPMHERDLPVIAINAIRDAEQEDDQ